MNSKWPHNLGTYTRASKSQSKSHTAKTLNLTNKVTEASHGPSPGHLLRFGSLGMRCEPKLSDICGRWRPLLSNKTAEKYILHQQRRRSDAGQLPSCLSVRLVCILVHPMVLLESRKRRGALQHSWSIFIITILNKHLVWIEQGNEPYTHTLSHSFSQPPCKGFYWSYFVEAGPETWKGKITPPGSHRLQSEL